MDNLEDLLILTTIALAVAGILLLVLLIAYMRLWRKYNDMYYDLLFIRLINEKIPKKVEEPFEEFPTGGAGDDGNRVQQRKATYDGKESMRNLRK